MAKMTRYQREMVLLADSADPICRGWIVAVPATVDVLLREGWATWDQDLRSARVTRAGLIAAGVDMDAVHTEALIEGFGRACLVDGTDSPRARTFLTAIFDGTSGQLRDVMDALHAEALADNGPWTNRLSREGSQAIRDAAHADVS